MMTLGFKGLSKFKVRYFDATSRRHATVLEVHEVIFRLITVCLIIVVLLRKVRCFLDWVYLVSIYA